MATEQHNKVLVIGVDGATHGLIRKWTEQDKLPNIKRLIDTGAFGLSKTVPNLNSAPAWTSIYTGCNPGKHGIYYFYEKKRDSYDVRFLNGSDCTAKPIWSILSEAGKTVGVVNVPMTYPAIAVNGFMISGMDAPGLNSKAVYPESILTELKLHAPEFVIELGLTTFARQGNFDKLIEKALLQIAERTKAIKYFMANRSWDFFMAVYRETDIIQHVFWKFEEEWFEKLRPDLVERYRGTILKIYQAIDDAIGEILDITDDRTTIAVVSDHGGGPFDHGPALLKNILAEAGLLRFHKPKDVNIFKQIINGNLKRGIDLAEKHLPRKYKEFLLRFTPELRNKAASNQIFSPSIDWNQSKVFCSNRSELWINLQGRENLGIVEPGKPHTDLIDQVKKLLLSWHDPLTGKPVVLKVLTKDEAYSGSQTDKAPDLTVIFNRTIKPAGISLVQTDGSVKTILEVDPNADVDSFLSGSHTDEGIVILNGPLIRQGFEIEEANLMDLAPTVLALLLGTDYGLDGRILTEVFQEPGLLKLCTEVEKPSNDPKGGGDIDYSIDEKEIIEDRLKDLGYL